MLNLKKFSAKKILIVILLLTAFLRLFRLDFPNKFIFDEVYHAFTAKEFLAGHKEAWEWWTTPPPGVAYEWTHPPLAKEIMAVSMFTFHSGDGWAWRLPGTLLGILSVYLVYLIAINLFKNQNVALISAFVFSIDGLNFVQSRIGMNDIYYVTFTLASLFLLLNKKFAFSAIFFGLALSSKWAAIYFSLLIFITLFLNKDFKKLIYFIIIPPLIYLLSYTPFFIHGHTIDQFIGLQKQMWWYHTNLSATHSYSSPWWSWPINLYPIWYFVDYQKDFMANIFASGNPAVFLPGLIAVILTTFEALKRRSKKLLLIILGFFIFWLPWALSPRIMFLYHYSPSIPFLSLVLGYKLNQILDYKNGRQIVLILMILMMTSFLFIFPFITGIHIPKYLVNLFFLTNITKNPF
ncbi:MAG: phospholipid carrier-dependent glycosyltransferase [Candidatus Daviesbacteria bacterium]|nr:phospholipid carrier-dependent glycosyltransferase [Candidatus Daviesbacteria bacterium]